VTFTATDDCGNTSTSTATFTIEDSTPPVIDIEASDLTVECDGQGNTQDLADWLANNGGASASDICSGVVWSNDFTALSDDCGATGSATVIFTATDDCGNTSTSTATFTIVDTIDPMIDVEASDLTVECDGSGNVQDLQAWLDSNGGASASDNCSNVTWSNDFTALSDDCGATGSATVVFTATDDCGNSVTTSATFTIVDTVPPVIDIVASDLTVECDGEGNVQDLQAWLDSNGGSSSSDDCSSVTWSNDFTALSDDCGATGSATVVFTATDDCGNSVTTSATFTIEDTAPPVIDIEATDLTVECDGQGNVQDLADWLASNGGSSSTDACSDVTWSNDFTALSDDCGATGSATVIFTATDDCGNSITTTATFTIEDTSAPEVITPFDEELTVSCSDIPDAPVLEFEDSCSTEITVEFEETSTYNGEPEDYQIIREWIVTDECGNSEIFTQVIFVIYESNVVGGDIEVCDDDEPFDLFDILSGDFTTDGQWEVIEGNATIDGSIFDPTTVEPGVYIIAYSVSDLDCPIYAEVQVTVIDCEVLPETDFEIFNGVTPDSDGINDYFIITGLELYPNNNMKIYNRWGILVYETDNYCGGPDCNGNVFRGISEGRVTVRQNEELPTGTYYYVLTILENDIPPPNGKSNYAGYLYVNR
jgi:gliding motility-associated-like protein